MRNPPAVSQDIICSRFWEVPGPPQFSAPDSTVAKLQQKGEDVMRTAWFSFPAEALTKLSIAPTPRSSQSSGGLCCQESVSYMNLNKLAITHWCFQLRHQYPGEILPQDKGWSKEQTGQGYITQSTWFHKALRCTTPAQMKLFWLKVSQTRNRQRFLIFSPPSACQMITNPSQLEGWLQRERSCTEPLNMSLIKQYMTLDIQFCWEPRCCKPTPWTQIII